MAKATIVHLGAEYDGRSPQLAEKYLAEGHLVSFVGQGPSMEPVIPDGTRMVFRHFDPEQETPEPGSTYFTRVMWKGRHVGYDNHMFLKRRRRHYWSGTPQGIVICKLRVQDIRGKFVGDWEELCRQR